MQFFMHSFVYTERHGAFVVMQIAFRTCFHASYCVVRARTERMNRAIITGVNDAQRVHCSLKLMTTSARQEDYDSFVVRTADQNFELQWFWYIAFDTSATLRSILTCTHLETPVNRFVCRWITSATRAYIAILIRFVLHFKNFIMYPSNWSEPHRDAWHVP